MKRGLVVFCLCLFVLPGIIASSTEMSNDNYNVESIELQVEDNYIEWEVEGYSSNGFKVVWSKNENPTYPTRAGDKYHYFSDSSKDSDTLDAFDGEGKYYVRVCEYLGGKCGVYSNEVEIFLGGYDKNEGTDVDETSEVSDDCDECQKVKEMEEARRKAIEKESEEIDDIECDEGCLLNETCYPLGYRKDGSYCSDTFEFVVQLEDDSVCDNNFECESNLCVSGECLSQGLIQKIVSWLKSFFG